jgi:hypothetical protein
MVRPEPLGIPPENKFQYNEELKEEIEYNETYNETIGENEMRPSTLCSVS